MNNTPRVRSRVEIASDYGISDTELRVMLCVKDFKTSPDATVELALRTDFSDAMPDHCDAVPEGAIRGALNGLLDKQILQVVSRDAYDAIRWIMNHPNPLTIYNRKDAVPRVGSVEFTPYGGVLFEHICYNRNPYYMRMFREEIVSMNPEFGEFAAGMTARQSVLVRGSHRTVVENYVTGFRPPYVIWPFGVRNRVDTLLARESILSSRIHEPTQLWRNYWWETPLPMWTADVEIQIVFELAAGRGVTKP